MTPSSPDPERHNRGSMPESGGNGTMEEKLKEDVLDVKAEAGAQAREEVKAGKHRLADGADALSDAIDAAASNLDDHDREGLARYARELSSNLASAAQQLEGRSVDELASDAKRLARDNPALFMLGSIAVGFGLSRFFKASADRDHQENDNTSRGDASRDNDSPRNAGGSPGMQSPGRAPDMTASHTASTAPRVGDRRENP